MDMSMQPRKTRNSVAKHAALISHGVLHADETPVAMLDQGAGKTKRAYLWSYAMLSFEPLQDVVYDFSDGQPGRQTCRSLLGRMGRPTGVRRLPGLQSLVREGLDRGRMPGSRSPQIPRTADPSQEPLGRSSLGALRRTLRH
jgi:hypothetical protein